MLVNMSPSRMGKPSNAAQKEQDLKTDNQDSDSPLSLYSSDSWWAERKHHKKKTFVIQFGSFGSSF